MSANHPSPDEAAIRTVLSSYEDALNASDTEAVMPLYTEDGVFMPPNNPSAVGKAAVRVREVGSPPKRARPISLGLAKVTRYVTQTSIDR